MRLCGKQRIDPLVVPGGAVVVPVAVSLSPFTGRNPSDFSRILASAMAYRSSCHRTFGFAVLRFIIATIWFRRMPPDTLPSHQTPIMKEPDSTSDW